MAGIFHLVIANKYLDTFFERITADRAASALEQAAATFSAHQKKSKDAGKTVAHFRLFANPVEAKKYASDLKGIQHVALDYNPSAGDPVAWVAKAIQACIAEQPKESKPVPVEAASNIEGVLVKIKVKEDDYVPSGVLVKTRSTPRLFTAVIKSGGEKVINKILEDKLVVSVSDTKPIQA